jgi:hypothetical protein
MVKDKEMDIGGEIADQRVCQVKCVSFFDFLSAVAFNR